MRIFEGNYVVDYIYKIWNDEDADGWMDDGSGSDNYGDDDDMMIKIMFMMMMYDVWCMIKTMFIIIMSMKVT